MTASPLTLREGRPRVTLGGQEFSVQAMSLRMFLMEVPTLTVELSEGVSTMPSSPVHNAGLSDVLKTIERPIGSTAPRVEVTMSMGTDAPYVMFRGYAVASDSVVATDTGRRTHRVTCVGLACPLTRRPGVSEVPFDCSSLVAMVRDAKLSSPEQIAASVSATEAMASGLRLTAASPESMLLQGLPDRIMGMPISRQISVILENLDRQSVFTGASKELTDEGSSDFDRAIGGTVDLPEGTQDHVRRAFSASLVAGLMSAASSSGVSAYEAVARLIGSDSYMLTLAPRLSLNTSHDCMTEIVPIQPPAGDPIELSRLQATSRSVRMGLWTQTPDVLFSLFASPLELASVTGRQSLATFYGVSALDPDLRRYLQSRAPGDFGRDLGTLNVAKRTLPAWAAAAIADPGAIVGGLGGDDARQPHEGSERTSPPDPAPTGKVREMCNRIADTQLTGLALAESKAFVSAPTIPDMLTETGDQVMDGLGRTFHLRMGREDADGTALGLNGGQAHVFGELNGLTVSYSAGGDAGGQSTLRTDLTLWRVRVASSNRDPLGDAPKPLYRREE